MTEHAVGERSDPLRPYRPGDLDAMYRVCLLTGDSGGDATDRYGDPRLLGEVFVGPYVTVEPELAFVLDDGHGAEGYVLGARDTSDFIRHCAHRWWPDVRERYRDYTPAPGRDDGWLLKWIASPPPAPGFADEFPSHLHIDLLPRWQKGGWGKRLMTRLCDELAARGSRGVHLGTSPRNTNAIGFYRHLGFDVIQSDASTVWMGLTLS